MPENDINLTLYRAMHPPVKLAAHLLGRVRVTGLSNIPAQGGLVLIANHLTNYDSFFIGMCFTRALRFMGKSELYRNPMIAALWRALGGFPIRRGELDRAALRFAEDLLRKGEIIAIFPEGHRSKTAQLQEAQGGAALLARRAAVPILPVTITGTEKLPPHDWSWRPWQRPDLQIHIGKPFTTQAVGVRLTTAQQTELITQRLAELLPIKYRSMDASSSSGSRS